MILYVPFDGLNIKPWSIFLNSVQSRLRTIYQFDSMKIIILGCYLIPISSVSKWLYTGVYSGSKHKGARKMENKLQ